MNGSSSRSMQLCRSSWQRLFQDSIDDTIARSDIFKSSRIIGGFAAFGLIGLVVLVVDMWSRLFPAPAPNAAQSVLNVLLRERALTTLASFSLLMLSFVGFLTVQALGGDAVNTIEKRLGRRLVRPVDFLSLAQVGSTASPKFQNFVQWLRTHTTWVALGVFALSLVLTWLLFGQASYAQWMGYSLGVCIVVSSLLAVTLQIVLFRRAIAASRGSRRGQEALCQLFSLQSSVRHNFDLRVVPHLCSLGTTGHAVFCG